MREFNEDKRYRTLPKSSNCVKVLAGLFILWSCTNHEKQSPKNILLDEKEQQTLVNTSSWGVYGTVRFLDSILTNKDCSELQYYGHSLDDIKGQIVIHLGDTSKENVERFKKQVLDSPYLRFENTGPFRLE